MNQGNEQSSDMGHKFILYGIVVGVIIGFLVGWYLGPHYKRSKDDYNQVARDALRVLDANGDRKISLEELYPAFKNREGKVTPLTQDQAKKVLQQIDRNKDGFIDIVGEFELLSLPGAIQKLLMKGVLAQVDKGQQDRYGEIKRDYKSVNFWMELFHLFGELFLNALKMLIVPLIITSMIGGVTALGDIRKLGKVGVYTVVFYTITTAVAVVVGIILVNIVQPGGGVDVSQLTATAKDTNKELSMFQVVAGFVHPNIIQAMAELEILPIIVFSLFIGGILTTMGERAKSTIEVINVFGEAIMKFVILILYFAPVGIFGLLAHKVGISGGSEGFGKELAKLGWYAFTVIFGLLVHALVVLPLILMFVARRNPFTYLRGMSQALLTAFSTASSSATLPVTMECAEKNNGVSNRAASFVCPLGATINMDGTALYEAVAAVFIAQMFGIHLSFEQQLLVVITATLAAIGAAGIPEAGLVTMVVVLEAVGLPLEGITFIAVIDWFLDRCRTTINVWGDSVGAAVIDTLVVKAEGSGEAVGGG